MTDKQKLTNRIRFWLREGEGLALREGDRTESVSAAEWQAHDNTAAAILEAVAVLWGVYTARGAE